MRHNLGHHPLVRFMRAAYNQNKDSSGKGHGAMPRTPKNHREAWTGNDTQALRQLARQNTPTRVIALKLQRTEGAVRSKATDIKLSLKPTNQSPYNRRSI